jgi:hypothetical protein
MSIERFAKAAVPVIWVLLVPAGIILAYYEWRGTLPENLRVLMPILYLGVLALLLRARAVKVADGRWQGIAAGHIHLVNLAKSLGCLLGALLWVYIAARHVPNSQVGVVILAVPMFVIFGFSVFFFSRAISGRS